MSPALMCFIAAGVCIVIALIIVVLALKYRDEEAGFLLMWGVVCCTVGAISVFSYAIELAKAEQKAPIVIQPGKLQ